MFFYFIFCFVQTTGVEKGQGQAAAALKSRQPAMLEGIALTMRMPMFQKR